MLSILVDEGRLSVTELAARAGISRATAYARYDRLVADGVISRFRADVDPHAIGLDVAAMILINVEQGSWPTTRDKVSRLPGVEYVAMTSGEFDFVLLVRTPDIAALRDVVLYRLQGMPRCGRPRRSSFSTRSAIPSGRRTTSSPSTPRRPLVDEIAAPLRDAATGCDRVGAGTRKLDPDPLPGQDYQRAIA